MKAAKPKVYVFGWPSFLGGADSKLAHLLGLLYNHLEFTVIPNDARHLKNPVWTKYLDERKIPFTMLDQLPNKLEGYAIAFSNQRFFSDRIAHKAKEKGLKIIWSCEMMWHHEGELDAIKEGLIDKVLYVSEFQKRFLKKGYEEIPSYMTGNYIDPSCFPFKERNHTTFTIGRLSRAAPEKYPEDFPVFYQCLDLPDVGFRVMAWDETLEKKFSWYSFDNRWDLLACEQEPTVDFLHSLDLFVYPLGHNFKESWGRSTVEAMLTGCIPLVPAKHHFENLIVTGETGFICSDFLEYKEHSHKLRLDFKFRKQMSRRCRQYAVENLCNSEEHVKTWMRVFQ